MRLTCRRHEQGTRGAAEAGIEATNHRFHAVEHSLCQLLAIDIAPGYLGHAPVHGQAVVRRGDNHVTPRYQPFLVHAVMMDECASRCFGNPDSLSNVGRCVGPHARIQNVRRLQVTFHTLQTMEAFD